MKHCFLVLLLISFFACKKSEKLDGTLNRDHDYFPLQKGYWIEYEVDSIIHLDTDDRYFLDTSIVSYHFYVREVVDSSFTDGMGEEAWYISRFKRTADSLPWTYTSTWTAKLRQASAERVEENQRYVKLSFPFTERSEWNGNAYNQFPEEKYGYDEMYSAVSVGNLQFDSSISVLQNDFSSSINRIFKIEKYAPKVGMIYKQTDSVRTALLPTQTIILNGYEYKVRVKDYRR